MLIGGAYARVHTLAAERVWARTVCKVLDECGVARATVRVAGAVYTGGDHAACGMARSGWRICRVAHVANWELAMDGGMPDAVARGSPTPVLESVLLLGSRHTRAHF